MTAAASRATLANEDILLDIRMVDEIRNKIEKMRTGPEKLADVLRVLEENRVEVEGVCFIIQLLRRSRPRRYQAD